MLNSCKALTSIDTTGWDTSNIENMNSMFHNCNALKTLDVSKFNTSKVTDMGHMFDLSDRSWFEEYELKTLDVSNWDTSKVTNMSYMFRNCKGLVNLDVSKWNTSKVTDMSGMFAYCHQLPEETILDVFNKWDTSNVTNMEDMFYSGPHCLSTSASLLSNWDTSNVTNMSGMFYMTEDNDSPEFGAALTTIKGVIDMKSCTEYDQMFWGCPNLTGVKIKNPPAGFRLDISEDQYEIVF